MYKRVIILVCAVLLYCTPSLAATTHMELPFGISFDLCGSWIVLSEEYKKTSLDFLFKETAPGTQGIVYLFGAQSPSGEDVFNIMLEQNPQSKASFQNAIEQEDILREVEIAMTTSIAEVIAQLGFSDYTHSKAVVSKMWGQKVLVISNKARMQDLDASVRTQQYVVYQDGYVLSFTFMTMGDAKSEALWDIKQSMKIDSPKAQLEKN